MFRQLLGTLACISAVSAACFMRPNGAVRCQPCCPLQRQKDFNSFSTQAHNSGVLSGLLRPQAPLHTMVRPQDTTRQDALRHQQELSTLNSLLKEQEIKSLNSLLKQQELISFNSLLKQQNSAVLSALMKQQDLTTLSSMLKFQDSAVLNSLLQLLNQVQMTKQFLANAPTWNSPANMMPPWLNMPHSHPDAYLNSVTRRLMDRDDTSQMISLLNLLLRIRQHDGASGCPTPKKCSTSSDATNQGTPVNFDDPNKPYEGTPDKTDQTRSPSYYTTVRPPWITTVSSNDFSTTTLTTSTTSYWTKIDSELIYNTTHLRNTAEKYYVPFSGYITKGLSVSCSNSSGQEEKSCYRYCDKFYKGHWIVVQHRKMNGTTAFNKMWSDYQFGFGDTDNGYWMGLECLHELTSKHICQVLIEITDSEGVVRVAHYGDFAVSSPHKGYMLRVSRFLGGSAGDGLLSADGKEFKTADHGTLDDTKCALQYGGGWWFDHCVRDGTQSHLNGYFENQNQRLGISWSSLPTSVGIVKTRMLIARTYGLALEASNKPNTYGFSKQSTAQSHSVSEKFMTQKTTPASKATIFVPPSTTASSTTSGTTRSSSTTGMSTTAMTSTTTQTTEKPVPGMFAGLAEMGSMKNNSATLTLLTGEGGSITHFKLQNYSGVASATSAKNVIEKAMNAVKVFYVVRHLTNHLVGSQPQKSPYSFTRGNKVCGNYGDSGYGGNWFIIQRRDLTTAKSFRRTWNDFVQGFGSWDTGYWIGLECLHRLTEDLPTVELLVELTDVKLNVAVAHYIGFSVGSAASNYALQYQHFLGGAAGNALNASNSSSFSAVDRDNDLYAEGNCASKDGGGWWFNTCSPGLGNNLNAEALAGEKLVKTRGLWDTWQTDVPILRTKILLRQHSVDENELYLTGTGVGKYKGSILSSVSTRTNQSSVSVSHSSRWSQSSTKYSSQYQKGTLAFVRAVSAYEYTFLSGLAYEAQQNAGKFYGIMKSSKIRSPVPDKPPYAFVVKGKTCGRYGDKSYGRNWFLVQKRNASRKDVTFDMPWEKYVEGFGGWAEGYWLGLECLYLMTNSAVHPAELFIELTDADENVATAHFSGVLVDGPQADYQIHFDKFLGGSAGDSLYNINGRKFTTFDRDNDGLQGVNCAAKQKGGWWYDACGSSSIKSFLNSDFASGGGNIGVLWQTWQTKYPIIGTKILLRVPTTDWLFLEEETFEK